MVRISVGGQTLGIAFQYDRVPVEDGTIYSHVVTATIDDVLGPNPDPAAKERWLTVRLATGVSKCSRKDIYSKSSGRKKALGRALKAACFDQKTRTLFWERLFSTQDAKGNLVFHRD